MLGFWFFRAVMPLSQIGSGGKAPNEATERREIGEATDRGGETVAAHELEVSEL